MFKQQSTWPPRQSLRDAVRAVEADEVYAPNGQYDGEHDDCEIDVAHNHPGEAGEPLACRWHSDRDGEYRVAPRSDVPLCDECAAQDRQGI